MIVHFRGIDLDTDTHLYRFTVLDSDGVLEWGSLEITNKSNDENHYWDNDTYLFEDLFDSLTNYSRAIPISRNVINDLNEANIPEDDYLPLLDLLESAISKGYYGR